MPTDSEFAEQLDFAIAEHPKEWARLTTNHKKIFNFLFGQIMKQNNRLEISQLREILTRKLLDA